MWATNARHTNEFELLFWCDVLWNLHKKYQTFYTHCVCVYDILEFQLTCIPARICMCAWADIMLESLKMFAEFSIKRFVLRGKGLEKLPGHFHTTTYIHTDCGENCHNHILTLCNRQDRRLMTFFFHCAGARTRDALLRYAISPFFIFIFWIFCLSHDCLWQVITKAL